MCSEFSLRMDDPHREGRANTSTIWPDNIRRSHPDRLASRVSCCVAKHNRINTSSHEVVAVVASLAITFKHEWRTESTNSATYRTAIGGLKEMVGPYMVSAFLSLSSSLSLSLSLSSPLCCERKHFYPNPSPRPRSVQHLFLSPP